MAGTTGKTIQSAEWTDATNTLALAVLKSQTGNAVASAYSAERALGMVLDGACGKTAEEMQNALALPAGSSLPQTLSPETQAASPNPEFSSASKPFSPAKYVFSGPHGTFVPFALTQSYAIKKSADALDGVLVPFGISYITGTPWTYPLFGFSAGFNPLTESAALLAGIYGGTPQTELLSYYALLQVEFDLDGYKTFSGF